jgi:hypothetical protein
MTTTTESILTKNQKKQFGPVAIGDEFIIAEIRFDDECGNGHNSFSITGEIYGKEYQRGPTITQNGRNYYLNSCGCVHNQIAKAFPELAPFIKWHLSSSDEPMRYAANATYWAGHCDRRWCNGEPNSPPNLEHLKSTICYGALPTDKDFALESCIWSRYGLNDVKVEKLKDWLESRSDDLQAAFRADVEKLGFTW